MRGRILDLRGQLLQRRKVIENPKAAPVGRDDHVVELLLNGNPVNRSVRQIVLQRLPVGTIVVGNEQPAFSANIQQARSDGIFAHAMRITQHCVWDAVGDRFPGPAVVSCFVDKRIAIVRLMAVDGDVRGARVVTRSLDITDRSPREHVGNVPGNVSPILAAVTGDLNNAIIRTSPDNSCFLRRLGYSKDDGRVLDADVVAGQATGESLPALIV